MKEIPVYFYSDNSAAKNKQKQIRPCNDVVYIQKVQFHIDHTYLGRIGIRCMQQLKPQVET